jgi:hypothetical protein
MTTWTHAAKAELENYFNRIRPGLATSGADPAEVIEDLRRHLDAEVVAARLSVVTEQDVRRLLARVGAPDDPQPTSPPPVPAPPPAAAKQKTFGVFSGGFLFFIGVILPVITLVLEGATGMCAGAFFDPLPTVWHHLLVAFVPVANAWAFFAVRNGDVRRRALLGWLNGAALAIAVFYAVIFLPLLLPGVFALLFFGWGLLPWSPMLSLIATVWLRRRLRQLGEAPAPLPGLWRGLALGVLALVLVQAPVTLTRVGVHWAAAEERSTALAGLRLLRTVGREEQMLRDCYGYTPGAQNMDLLGMLISGSERVPAEKAREIFYRVTGIPFNAVPAPVVRTGRGVFGDLNNWTWDDDHGGDKVGGRIRGLSLAGSRLDATVNPGSAWSYTEWTLEFRNDSSQPREARAQIQLPPGGVVSRLTLWVNGEEREAAFAGRSQVREAYREVAVVRRRDPVLINTAGPDRVLMQCFPVPAGGGTMKVRFGITAPLLLDTAAEGIVRLPTMLERNFSIREGFTHSVWVDGGELQPTAPQLVVSTNAAGQMALRGQLSNLELASPGAVFRVKRDPAVRHAWTRDSRSASPQFIRQTLTEQPARTPRQIVVVVDGSVEMQPYFRDLAAALGTWSPPSALTVLVASDEPVQLGQRSARSSDAGALEGLASWRGSGGQDNVPALQKAFELAGRDADAVVLWIHGPQPAIFASTDPLVQTFERSPNGPRLFDFQVVPGPDRVTEKLDGVAAVVSVPRLGSVSADLKHLLDSWRGGAKRIQLSRMVAASETAAQADGAVQGGQHVARLWAQEEVRRLAAQRQVAAAVKEAAQHQLVTPFSGAVVLENQAQFAAAGLEAVDPQTVPSIPEPAAASVFLLGGALLLIARRWRPAARQGARCS